MKRITRTQLTAAGPVKDIGRCVTVFAAGDFNENSTLTLVLLKLHKRHERAESMKVDMKIVTNNNP